MQTSAPAVTSDKPVALLTLSALLAVSLFLQNEFQTRQALLFLIGAGLGATLLHAAFGFAGGWRRLIRERRSTSARAQILLLGVTSILFFPVLGQLFSGISVQAAVAPVGLSVLIGAFVFGIGMQLGGGCGSGTLFTVGGGHVAMLITLVFFIVGSTIASAHLHWWLALPSFGKLSLISTFGWGPALAGQALCLLVLYAVVLAVERRRHDNIEPLFAAKSADASFTDRLVLGPWPLLWGVIGLAVFNLLTLVIAGHPWSITFAFGLWGAKIWSAIGGDAASWPYWSSGYPAVALSRSVLADNISVMDFGLILGAVLAAALAGKFAPEGRIKRERVVASVVGGLLLGYGARLAFGCNIGALLAGIGSGSLHGWLWLAAGFVGSLIGVRLRVRLQLDPPTRK